MQFVSLTFPNFKECTIPAIFWVFSLLQFVSREEDNCKSNDDQRDNFLPVSYEIIHNPTLYVINVPTYAKIVI